MKERGLEFKVGLLIVVSIALLSALVVTLGNFSLAKGFNIFIDFDFAGNLHVGAPVKVAGIPVGKVTEISFRGGKTDLKANGAYVRVTAWVEDRVRGTIYRNAEFFINTQGVLGQHYLEIVPGTPDHPAIQPDEVLLGATPPRTDLIFSRIYQFLDHATRLLRDEKQSIGMLLRKTTMTVETINTLLTTNKDEIHKVLTHLGSLAEEATGLTQQIRQGVGDPKRIHRMIDQLDKTTASIQREIDPLLMKTQRTLDSVHRVTSSLGDDEQKNIKKIVSKLAQLADAALIVGESARDVVVKVSKGEGTAGSLLMKDELYEDLREMVRDLKVNPWKFLWRK